MRLTGTKLRNAKPKQRPYRLTDGHGLYVPINPNGAKLWRWKFRFMGREKLMAFGSYPEVPLTDARAARPSEIFRENAAAGLGIQACRQCPENFPGVRNRPGPWFCRPRISRTLLCHHTKPPPRAALLSSAAFEFRCGSLRCGADPSRAEFGGPIGSEITSAVLPLVYRECTAAKWLFPPGSPTTGLRRWGGSRSHLSSHLKLRGNWRTALKPALGAGDSGGVDAIGCAQLGDGFREVVAHRSF